jgi:hypothetical protein
LAYFSPAMDSFSGAGHSFAQPSPAPGRARAALVIVWTRGIERCLL